MITNVTEVNNDKTKVNNEFIFYSVSLVLLPNTMSKLIDNWIEYMQAYF